jgi:hypothetical protein
MVFTRGFDRARFQVLILNPDLIPLSVDVVIGDYIYELHFCVEPEEGQDMPTPMDMGDDDGDYRAENGTVNSNKDGKETETQFNPNSGKSAEKSQMNSQSTGNQGSHESRCTLYHIPALEWVPQESENDDTEMGDVMQQQAGELSEDDTAIGTMLSNTPMNTSANTQVAELAAIPEASAPSYKRGRRRAGSADEHSLKRAKGMKASKTLDAPSKQGNNLTEKSFIHFTSEEICHNLEKLGFCLRQDSEMISTNVTELRNLEVERM